MKIEMGVIHKVLEKGFRKIKGLVCCPQKGESVVEIMIEYKRATFGWEQVTCSECLASQRVEESRPHASLS
jgi:hypothetical protein